MGGRGIYAEEFSPYEEMPPGLRQKPQGCYEPQISRPPVSFG
jgi:hypothetical protein